MDLKPTLVHGTVPRVNTNVFLLASLTNDSANPFLPGEAAIYFGNSFVAKVIHPLFAESQFLLIC